MIERSPVRADSHARPVIEALECCVPVVAAPADAPGHIGLRIDAVRELRQRDEDSRAEVFATLPSWKDGLR